MFIFPAIDQIHEIKKNKKKNQKHDNSHGYITLIQCCLPAIKTLTHNQSLYRIFSVKRWSFFSSKTTSYKTDLHLSDLIRKGKIHIKAKFHRTDLVICSHSRKFYYKMEFFFF